MSDYLSNYLPNEKKLKSASINAHATTFSLLLEFFICKRIKSQFFKPQKLTKELVLEFIEWYQQEKKASIASCNLRLSTMRNFASYLMEKDDTLAKYVSLVTYIPTKKAEKKKEVEFLSEEQALALINLPDSSEPKGEYHKLVLTLLYVTACNVQELCNLNIEDITLGEPSSIHIKGDGVKDRTLPLSKYVAQMVADYIAKYRKGATKDEPIILDQYNRPLTKGIITNVVRANVRELRKRYPNIPESISPKSLRQSRAHHLFLKGMSDFKLLDYLGLNSFRSIESIIKRENINSSDVLSNAINALDAFIH